MIRIGSTVMGFQQDKIFRGGDMSMESKNQLCDKIFEVLREARCTVGQAIEALEITKGHVLSKNPVVSVDDLKKELREQYIHDSAIGKQNERAN